MPEILTESFCERCGTRYTFEAVAPKTRPLAKLKIVSRGLKNYVLSDETSLDEAFADARSDEQRAISAQQLDAFHKAFSFCMSCRQYTCGNCWNEIEGRCLTCAPHLGHEILPGPFPVVDTRLTEHAGAGGNGSSPGGPEPAPMIAASAWPTVDLRPPAGTPSPGTIPGSTVDGMQVAAIAAAPGIDELTPPSVDERAAVAAATTTSLLGRFRPVREHEPTPGAEDAATTEAAGPVEDGTVAAAASPAADVAAAAALAEDAAAAPEGAEAGVTVADAAIVAAAAAGAAAGMAASDAGVADVDSAVADAGAVEPQADTGLTPAELAEISAAALAARALRDDAGRQAETRPSAGGPKPKIEAPREPEADMVPKVAAAAMIADAAAETAETAETAAGAEPAEIATASPETTPAAAAAPAASQVWSMVAPEAGVPSAAAAQPGADGAPAGPPPAPSFDSAPQPQWPQAPARSDAPQWPTEPQWPPSPAGGQGDLRWPVAAMSDPRPASGAPAFASPPTGSDALWAASSRDVLSRPGSGVQACVSCGLPLSATARFCRRCGSRQG